MMSAGMPKRTQPEVVVICHLLLNPVRLKPVDEKCPEKGLKMRSGLNLHFLTHIHASTTHFN